jgi:hypothetical protein
MERDSFADRFEKFECSVFDRGIFGIEDQIGVLRWFEGSVLAGEVLDFATGSLGIESFDVTLFARLVAGLDIHLEEIRIEETAGQITQVTARGDGGNEGDDPLGHEDFGGFRDAPDIFQAILIGEAEVGIEPGAEVVAIENGGETTLLVENPFRRVGEGGLAGTRESVEPNDDAMLAEKFFLILAAQEAVEFRVDVHAEDDGLRNEEEKTKFRRAGLDCGLRVLVSLLALADGEGFEAVGCECLRGKDGAPVEDECRLEHEIVDAAEIKSAEFIPFG